VVIPFTVESNKIDPRNVSSYQWMTLRENQGKLDEKRELDLSKAIRSMSRPRDN
jgi:hypothetical protein